MSGIFSHPDESYKYKVVFTELFNVEKNPKTTDEYKKEYIQFLHLLIDFTERNLIIWDTKTTSSYSNRDISYIHNISNINKSESYIKLSFSKVENYNSTYSINKEEYNNYKLEVLIRNKKFSLSLPANVLSTEMSNLLEKLRVQVANSYANVKPIKTVIDLIEELSKLKPEEPYKDEEHDIKCLEHC